MPFLEESGLVPTEKYSHGPELLEHARTVGRKFDLYKNAILSTEVTEIRWDDATTRYTIRTNRGDELRVRFLIVATGLLARIKLPGVPGIDKFKGGL